LKCSRHEARSSPRPVLAEPKWAEKLTDADRRALLPLFWTHVNPYLRRFELNMKQPARPHSPALRRATYALARAALRGRRRPSGWVGIMRGMDETHELTEDEVNDLLSDDDRDAGGEDAEYKWVR
jgi:hypothetical protein